MSQHEDTIRHARMFLENMVGLAMQAEKSGMGLTPAQLVEPTLNKLVELAQQHFPLAKVLDDSDIVLHAEGPGATHDLPWIGALNWLTSTAETNIKHLAAAFFDMHGANGKSLARHIEPRLTGVAPGSLWVGICLAPDDKGALNLPEVDGPTLADEIHQLPELVRYIDDEGISEGIEDVSPDPAMRDISLNALLKFSPTGRKGIHTLEISTRQEGVARLGQRERVVLREAVEKPTMRQARVGSFVGEIREADLDKTRLHLRSVPGVGTLRCVVPELNIEQAKHLLGRYVRAVGSYQVNRDGKPRLLFVERFEEVRMDGPNLDLL
ncbi:hypothetical protein MI467_03315 [Delftia acidovorans]|uniref:hypothetical protein n=1 Tax=Delftia acidovorans TaxID=80866 RepID=UPI001EFCAEC0|nr:hypothetical protein [Delftia acidovorans]MCG8985866.1 hypothetical protein [Delftia acidovorans]